MSATDPPATEKRLPRVLIVDDDPINLAVAGRLTEEVPAQAVLYSQPKQALRWSQQSTADAVIIDYKMPELDGLTLLAELRKQPTYRQVPIVMITASEEDSVRYEALDLGANDFLAKPLDPIETVSRLRNMLALRAYQKRINRKAADLETEVRKRTEEIRGREREIVFRLARAAEYRDQDTGAHLLRIAHYSQLLGSAVGLDNATLELLTLVSPMHDIGKVAIPDHILLKPGKLDAEEWEIMKMHTTIGHDILSGSSAELVQVAAQVALTHHEWWNGAGYPNGLKGDDIPLFGRIVSVADCYDALTSERPYKKAWTQEKTVQVMRENSGTQFEPRLLEMFFEDLELLDEIRAQYQEEFSVAQALDRLLGY